MDNKERFVELCSAIKRDGIDDLMAWLADGDFYTAPASARYHGSYAGGLLQHSLNVYDELKRLLAAYPEVECSEESAVICALFHDLCKVNFYTSEKRNRKAGFQSHKILGMARNLMAAGWSLTSVSIA
ncbi:MAG: HD domain-containing protein [Clostridiales bacterium]|nr:HD domain-containing protein [Clostridiales bacterium]